jgi:hypothetical protein
MKLHISLFVALIALFASSSCNTQTVPPSPKPTDGMVKKQATSEPVATPANPLTGVYAAYFALKDALVATDGAAAAEQAKTLFAAIGNVKMDSLTTAQHTVWMKYQQKLSSDADYIKGSVNTDKQRSHFASLSTNMIEVMKVVKPGKAVYLEHCPMYDGGKGGDWLSTEEVIRNPYYGKKMLTCGSVTETLK